jgi:hypothetical protein
MAEGSVSVEAANQGAARDPIQQALARYAKQAGERMVQSLHPVRKGTAFALSGTGRTPQVAAIGVLMALLLPAMRASDDAQPAAPPDDAKQLAVAIRKYLTSRGQFPFKSAVMELIGKPPAEPEKPAENGFLADAFSGDPSVQVLRIVAYFLGFMVFSLILQFPLSWLRRRKRKTQ